MVYVKKRGMRSKRSYRRKPSAKSRKGLTKTEKTQVKTIAKRTVNSLAETKYFNCQAFDQEETNAAWENNTGGTTVRSEISVLGFAVGSNKAKGNDAATDAYKYGVNANGNKRDMRQLKMNQVYLYNSPDSQLRANAIEGNTLRPSYNETQWLLDRFTDDTTNDFTKGLPYKIRMIRARPRVIKSSSQVVNPEEDLFLTSSNQAFGISSRTSLTGPFIMNSFEFHLAKPNSRKYHILEDTTMIINPNMNYYNAGAAEEFEIPYATSAVGCTQKQFKRSHKLGTELFYPRAAGDFATDPIPPLDDDAFPTDGFTPEFVLFHIIKCGDDTSVANRNRPESLRISCRPVSTFKDI